MENFYDTLLNIFVDPIRQITEVFVGNETALTILAGIFNSFMALVIVLWVGRRLKDGDMFNWQSMFPDAMKLILLTGVTNFALFYPGTYYEYFYSLINVPQEAIMPFMEKSSNVIIDGTPMLRSDGRAGLPALVTKIVETVGLVWERAFSNEITIWGGLGGLVCFAILCLVVSFLQFAFLALLIFIVISTTVEIMIWGALSVPLLPLLFFKETFGSYMQFLKKLVSLSLYKPLILFVALLDVYSLEFIIGKLPKTADNLNAPDPTGLNPFVLFLMMFLMTMICTMILQKIPDMINALTGHYNNSTTISQVGNMMMKGAGKMLALGMAGGRAGKGVYDGAGGGLGGVMATAGAFLTAGLGRDSLEKGGQKINDIIGQFKGGKTGVEKTGGGGGDKK